MTKSTTASTVLPVDEAAALRRRESELEAEGEQLEKKRDALRRRRAAATDANNGDQLGRILAGKARTDIKAIDVELARLDEEIRENAESSNVVSHALIKHDRQAVIAELAEKFAAARANLPKLEAALNQLEAVMKAAEPDLYAYGQAVSAHSAFMDRFAKEIPFNPDEIKLLKFWRGEFVPFSEARLATEAETRDELFASPTKLERWRQLAAELRVGLGRPAVWPERWTNIYTPLKPRPKGAARNVVVRLRTTMAGPDPDPPRRSETAEEFAKRVPTFVHQAGAIIRVTEQEAEELEAGRYAERVNEALLDRLGNGLSTMLVRLKTRFSSPQGIVHPGEVAEVLVEEGTDMIAGGMAEPFDARSRQLVGATAETTADDDEWNTKEN